MGVDWSAYVVVGVKAEKRSVAVEVTKYNENTGKPYTKQLQEDRWYLENTDIQIPEDLIDEEECLESGETIEIEGGLELGLHMPDYEGKDGVLGVSVSTSNGYYGEMITPLEIGDSVAVVTEYLSKKLDYKGDVKTYSILHCSY